MSELLHILFVFPLVDNNKRARKDAIIWIRLACAQTAAGPPVRPGAGRAPGAESQALGGVWAYVYDRPKNVCVCFGVTTCVCVCHRGIRVLALLMGRIWFLKYEEPGFKTPHSPQRCLAERLPTVSRFT